ncbi:MAG: hypothetical protein M3Y08_09945 [Fibrobacterota bacterium]|nr:hypothetical protein [Fibrobacterota bacterium]
MIRINLLKALETRALPLILEEPSGKRKQTILVVAALALVAAGGISVLQFPNLFGGIFGGEKEAEETVATSPSPAPAEEYSQPKRVTSQAVEETVRDIHEDQGQKLAATYADLVPSQKVEFQYYASDRILKDIKSVTPPDIGFANFIFTPPGEFYVHGLAATEQDLARFNEGLRGLSGATIKPGMNVPAGTRGQSKEFSFFGSLKYPLNEIPTPPNHVVAKADLQKELKLLKSVAASMGIRLKEPKLTANTLAGNSRKLLYATSAESDFQQMQDFLAALHQGKSNLGVVKFAFRARGDEKVIAELDLVAYVEP